jgi:hypothetical protein
MKKLSPALITQYETELKKGVIPNHLHDYYKKWLRYYLDFCSKYGHPYSGKNSIELFIEKLKEKKQNPGQQAQARVAIQIYYDLLKINR